MGRSRPAMRGIAVVIALAIVGAVVAALITPLPSPLDDALGQERPACIAPTEGRRANIAIAYQ